MPVMLRIDANKKRTKAELKAEVFEAVNGVLSQRVSRALLTTAITRNNIEGLVTATIKVHEISQNSAGGLKAGEFGPAHAVFKELAGIPKVADSFQPAKLKNEPALTGDAGPSVEYSDAEMLAEAKIPLFQG
jgi:hypothetical protein